MTGEEILNSVRHYIGDSGYYRYDEIIRAHKHIVGRTNQEAGTSIDDTVLTLVAGATTYTLDITAYRSIDNLFYQSATATDTNIWEPLSELDYTAFNEKVKEGANDSSPKYYIFLKGTTNNFMIFPIPGETYNIRIAGTLLTSEITRNTSPLISKEHHYIIAILAAGYILEEQNEKGNWLHTKGLSLQNKAMADIPMIQSDVSKSRTSSLSWKGQRFLK